MSNRIKHITGRQIYDSRGNPTVEAWVTLENGITSSASVPSGASTGKHEAHELRDDDRIGVNKAVKNINGRISGALKGMNADDQPLIDSTMCALDGTKNKSSLGANAMLAVSLACAKASSAAYNLPLFRYIGGINAVTMPIPMMNILNGGAHANNSIDIQEFMIMPIGAHSFSEAMKMCTAIYSSLKSELKGSRLSVSVGDEGGFAPDLESNEAVIELIIKAAKNAGYNEIQDYMISLDIAASEWYEDGMYVMPKCKKAMDTAQMISWLKALTARYPIISIEDPLQEDDFEGFADITNELDGVQIVGDDLFVTNTERIIHGIEKGSASAVLIKPNQIGTLTEALSAIETAKSNGMGTVISHRSGETESTVIADIAVAVNAGQIKAGAPARGERTAKYNRLLKIEEILGVNAVYPTN